MWRVHVRLQFRRLVMEHLLVEVSHLLPSGTHFLGTFRDRLHVLEIVLVKQHVGVRSLLRHVRCKMGIQGQQVCQKITTDLFYTRNKRN